MVARRAQLYRLLVTAISFKTACGQSLYTPSTGSSVSVITYARSLSDFSFVTG
jgi:hypothetical protein